jgi:hypothetical protein
MARILQRLTRVGLRKWWNGSSSTWFYLGVGAIAIRVIRKVLSPQYDVKRIRVKSGETYEIRSRRR